ARTNRVPARAGARRRRLSSMCLGIPGRVLELGDNPHLATVDVFGAKRQINLDLLDEPVQPGDWVLIHVGFALSKLDEAGAGLVAGGLDLLHGEEAVDLISAPVDLNIINRWIEEEEEQWA